jgi:hypothetical protein
MYSLSIVFTAIMLTKPIMVLVNPDEAFMDNYKWTGVNATCRSTTAMGTFCTANMSLAKSWSTSYAVVLADNADLRGLNVDPAMNLLFAYNYTGPSWVLKVGIAG